MTTVKKTVLLIVDLDDNFLEVAQKKLVDRNLEVLTANSTAKAVNALENFIIDSVLFNVRKTQEQKIVLDYIRSMTLKPVVILLDNELKVIQ